MKTFLPNATDFTGIEIKPRPDLLFESKSNTAREYVICPKCGGHGFWNLELNAYGAGKHFQGGCGQCNSWGWVEKGTLDETCIHEYKEIAPDQPWRCWHTYRCTKCGRTISQDSSD